MSRIEVARTIAQILERHGWESGTDVEDIVSRRLISWGFTNNDVKQQHKVLTYRLDYAWLDIKVCLEVDGPWHYTLGGGLRDRERDSLLAREDWLTFRIDARVVDVDFIERQLLRVVKAIRGMQANNP